MKIKGIDKFQEKVPILSGKKLFLLPLYAFPILLLCILVMIGFDSIPDIAKSSGVSSILLPFFPLIGEVIVCIVGLILVDQMWFWKDRLKAKYGQLSYQHICLVGFAGTSCLVSLSVNLFIHYWSFSSLFWMSSSLKFLTILPEEYFYFSGLIIFWIKIILSVFFLVFGITMMIRSLQTFGFDYMSVIYLYFPEESKMQNHRIYSVIRHPMYTGILLLGLGGMFSTLTLYSVIFFLVYFLAFYIHIRFVEEKELILRFGPSYQEYIKKVPAFFVTPNKIGAILGFLLGKSDNRL
jgi:protein-S-isoprenylcysteine O-methyltransferase Ste14